ncbi:non-ribosomal peptide synthetase [Sphingomonas sp. 1185]|uniref:non-ribosomal peptide synthetase n=1 Tax=Sphingomonas sp. 1185 TaxID=3156411 RepID=UPI0033957048
MAAQDVGSASIVGRFTHIAREHKDALALVGDDLALSYADLDAMSDRLARRLVALGAAQHTPVALMLPRSVAAIVTILAIVKSGAPYLAIDPAQPIARTMTMLRDAKVTILVVSAPIDTEFNNSLDGQYIRILDDPMEMVDVPSATLPCNIGPADLAYVAYTSGSTGRPKGVCIPNDAVLRLVVDSDFIDIRSSDVFLHFAPIAFDASTLEIWGPLLNGAKLAVAPSGPLTSEEIAAVVDDFEVTTLWLTAGLFHQFGEPEFERLTGLRYLIAGGDTLSPNQVERARTILTNTIVVNGYGPTENTTFTCTHAVLAPIVNNNVPIGRPIAGTHIAILDNHLAPVATGETGELYIGGRGLARCYLGDAQLTAARFVADPRPGYAGHRLYRSGDNVRDLGNDRLEFLGRVDGQCKIRGYRVEIGDVEVAVSAHPEVDDKAVIARKGPDGQVRLVAFYVAQAPIPGSEMRRMLAEYIPSYMIPASFVRLDVLPLNANGKIDRAALQRFDLPARPDVATQFRRPETEIERWLVQLWSDLLEVKEIGIDDDFFELGGHSLLAIKITAEIRAEYNAHIPVHRFYESPSARDVAALIGEVVSSVFPTNAAA